jgi:4'-phosphopantetheinyl transferase EntD
MIEEILPERVRAVEVFDDEFAPSLFPEEEAQLVGAVDGRYREFATVRACARRALGDLGLPPVALPRGDGGAPVWPAGIVGSMTHCEGYRSGAVAWSTDIGAIGIDAEPAEPLPGRVLDLVALPQERNMLAELVTAVPSVCWDRLLFCMKEAVYKAWFPLAKRWLGFEDVLIGLDRDGTFTARLLVPGPAIARVVIEGLGGRWILRDDLVLAAIAGSGY